MRDSRGSNKFGHENAMAWPKGPGATRGLAARWRRARRVVDRRLIAALAPRPWFPVPRAALRGELEPPAFDPTAAPQPRRPRRPRPRDPRRAGVGGVQRRRAL